MIPQLYLSTLLIVRHRHYMPHSGQVYATYTSVGIGSQMIALFCDN